MITLMSPLIAADIIRNFNFVTIKEIFYFGWGRNYQSDPQVLGTIGKVLKRPFQWSLNNSSIICSDKVMVF